MASESGLASPTPPLGAQTKVNGGEDENCNESVPALIRSTSYDPTPYVQRARVTRAAPPKPACNPMQFVQIKPCSLYQSAQDQLKRAEELKKVKEVKKEEPEDWQSNLDNWKSCRRKRVEHIIDRVVEVKKLEMEEHDRTRRKSKTFSEMLEERGTKGRKCSLPIYTEDDVNDFSDLGIGTSSTSGKSSLSEDFDNHSVISDNPDTEKVHSDTENQSTQGGKTVRDYISSPGYDTSSSNAPTSSPDPCEYTYEGAIQDYKSRVLRASSNTFIAENGAMAANATVTSIVSSIKAETIQLPKAKSSTGDIEYLLNAFAIHESTSNTGNDRNGDSGVDKKNLPKIDILKRRAIFEKESAAARKSFETTSNKAMEELSTKISIKERVSSLENREEVTDAAVKKRLSGEFNRVKNRLSNIESPIVNSIAVEDKPPKIDVPVAPLKDRLFSLQSAAFEERSRDPPKKIDLLGDQRLIGLDKMNGNHDYQLETESELKTSTNYNIYTQEYAQHNIAVQSSGAPLTSFDDLLPDDSDLQLNAYEQLEVIQEEREEQQLQQQYNMSVQIPAKKPEVMPRTTRNITPDPQQKAAERIANVSLDDLQEQDENNSDLNDDGDFRDDSVIEALDIALNAIDIEKPSVHCGTVLNGSASEQIYEDIDDLNTSSKTQPKADIIPKSLTQKQSQMPNANTDEPYYQVPKRAESYYEVPKSCPIPVYENVDMYYDNTASSGKFAVNGFNNIPIALDSTKQVMEPPKEKPPPPPEDSTDDEQAIDPDLNSQDGMKRMNSTKRIKKEIRNKRSSFLGIDGGEDEHFLELTVAPPPDMAAFIQEERRLEKQMYIKAGLYDSSDTGDSRDSGVSENHSRQSSEPLTTSSEEPDQETATYIQDGGSDQGPNMHERQAQVNGNRGNGTSHDWLFSDKYHNESDPILKHLDERERMKCIEDDLQEKEEVLKVERELLQLEQEELKRQRANLSLRKSYEQLDDHTILRGCTQDVDSSANVYANMPNRYDFYQVQTNYRKSMPNLQSMNPYESDDQMALPPKPPAKPLRVQEYLRYGHKLNGGIGSMDAVNSANPSASLHLKQSHYHSQSTEDFVPSRPPTSANAINSYANMSRHTLHALSAVPKPKFQDAWVQQRNQENDLRHNDYVNSDAFAHQTSSKSRYCDARMGLQPLKRNSELHGFNYNNHWLIQEAEQRRVDQQRTTARAPVPANNSIQRRGSNDNKPLPDAVIQTLTQRVQSRLGDKKRLQHYHAINNINSNIEKVVTPQHQHYYHGHQHQHLQINNMLTIEPPKEILSVSGKKKCSYCDDELGRGAAMIIESLRLFYHLDCFKCCVCRVQLGDGISGADVRVRNQKLHCNNCFSNDDGIKFSCV